MECEAVRLRIIISCQGGMEDISEGLPKFCQWKARGGEKLHTGRGDENSLQYSKENQDFQENQRGP